MDIQSAEFDSEDPGSWGFTQDERRVWAVKAHGGRAYYSVGNEPPKSGRSASTMTAASPMMRAGS